MSNTTYKVLPNHGLAQGFTTDDASVADRESRNGARVTAITGGDWE